MDNLSKKINKLVEILKIEDNCKDLWNKRDEYMKEGLEGLYEDIILSEILDDDKREKYVVRKDSPYLARQGTSQILLRLDSQTLAKSQKCLGDFFKGIKSHYFIQPYEEKRITTENLLRYFGLNVPEHIYLSSFGNDKFNLQISESDGGNFLLIKDLTENGKYIVKDFDISELVNLQNGKQLEKEYDKLFNEIYKIKQSKKYFIEINDHVMKSGDISEAIQHLFMVKINPKTNLGELIAEDTNHLTILKK